MNRLTFIMIDCTIFWCIDLVYGRWSIPLTLVYDLESNCVVLIQLDWFMCELLFYVVIMKSPE